MRGVVGVAGHDGWGREYGPSCCEWGVRCDARLMGDKCRGGPKCLRGVCCCAGQEEIPGCEQGVVGVAGR